ncbi:type IV toxin-antitoxin system AbiEi family antitoxin domain-containing protein [Herbiconiux solani]|uniref:type IV toxin-antitoxin system AbiEi family antitoxin domain-containing protein n=1 Tax=Herbiconiux solani TaxID=661329 RepID=UPI0008248D7B|nr:type IV toxin-antitoxin system AbiEi family antitoxin domain-containing protein [Herbiconiux solani]
MTQVLEMVSRLGGIASVAALNSRGIPSGLIHGAVERGQLERVRRGWVALPDAPVDAVRAVRVGGRVSCLSVLKSEKIWCARDSRLHIRVPARVSELSSPHDRRIPLGRPERFGITVHRSLRASGLAEPEGPVDSFTWALLHSIVCQSKTDAIVTLDSALSQRRISRTELEFLVAELPTLYRGYLDLTDPGAASGLETKARLGLHRYNIPYRSQVPIPGAGFVDLLIGDRLVLELDGREWHSSDAAFTEDRRRDLTLAELGCLVLRLSYDQVMGEWSRVIAVIRALVARGEHRWSARHRRDGLAVRFG